MLLSGAGILGELSGVIGGLRSYFFMVSAHVIINLGVAVSHLAIWLFVFIFASHINLEKTVTFETTIKIGGVTFVILNLAAGFLFRRDLQLIHYREKLSRCTCSYIAAAQAQYAQQQQAAQQAQHQAVQQMHSGGGPGGAPPVSQYITGPDGSRYMVARPPPIGAGPPRPGNPGGNGSGGGGGGGGSNSQDDWPPMMGWS